MDKIKLIEKVMDCLQESPHLDEFDIANIDGKPHVDDEGNISFSMDRTVSGGLRKSGPVVVEVITLSFKFERKSLSRETGEVTTESF